jgi:hypothetical protein
MIAAKLNIGLRERPGARSVAMQRFEQQLLNAFRNPFCNSGITGPGVIGGDMSKIGDGAL